MIAVLFVGSELMARARLGSAERTLAVTSPGLLSAQPVGDLDIVVADLDETGAGVAATLRENGFEGRIVGFFSHVNEALGDEAAAAGIEVYPRGRFWREVDRILS